MDILGLVVNRFHWLCHAYCLMAKRQRYLGRPELKRLFAGKLNKDKRDRLIADAVNRYGYSQREVADFPGLHYSTASRLATGKARNKT